MQHNPQGPQQRGEPSYPAPATELRYGDLIYFENRRRFVASVAVSATGRHVTVFLVDPNSLDGPVRYEFLPDMIFQVVDGPSYRARITPVFQASATSAAKPRRRTGRILGYVAAAVAALVLGVASGLAFAPSSATPASCVESIERADELIASAAETISISQQGITAAAEQDVATLESLTEQVQEQIPVTRETREAFDAAAADCRAGAK